MRHPGGIQKAPRLQRGSAMHLEEGSQKASLLLERNAKVLFRMFDSARFFWWYRWLCIHFAHQYLLCGKTSGTDLDHGRLKLPPERLRQKLFGGKFFRSKLACVSCWNKPWYRSGRGRGWTSANFFCNSAMWPYLGASCRDEWSHCLCTSAAQLLLEPALRTVFSTAIWLWLYVWDALTPPPHIFMPCMYLPCTYIYSQTH